MCGRYVSVASTFDLVAEFGIEEVTGEELPPSWNVAPTDPVRIVVGSGPDAVPAAGAEMAAPVRKLCTARWGLAPHWASIGTPNPKMINARSETVSSKPAFAAAVARRRCLVPALGYYEWKRDGERKLPHFLQAPDRSALAMAGIYEVRREGSPAAGRPGGLTYTCAIITRAATDLLGDIHDRCPVLVPPDRWEAWLDCRAADSRVAERLIAEMPEPQLAPHPVSASVGNVRNNGPHLVEAVSEQAQDVLPLET